MSILLLMHLYALYLPPYTFSSPFNFQILLYPPSLLLLLYSLWPTFLFPSSYFSPHTALADIPPLKGTVSRDWDVLLVVWMDRALFGDEPLTGFITICCFLVFNFVFYFLQRYCTKVAPLCVSGATLLQIYHRLIATLRQICYRG